MSTKAIRRMMEHYQRITNIDGVPRKVQLMDVIEEVDAIERAAKFYTACPAIIRPKELREDEGAAAHETVCSIAKDAP